LTATAPLTELSLRRDAEGLAASFPPLLAKAQHLAATLSLGAHGRRRAGTGEEFWQYRHAGFGDGRRDIDWRRSGRSDAFFVRQTEWQSAQSVHIWVDDSRAMGYREHDGLPSKAQRAQLLGLATAILLSQAGERVGLIGDAAPPRQGQAQINKIAHSLAISGSAADYGTPPQKAMALGSRAIFLSDFLGDWDAMVPALAAAADQNVQGALVQVLDPSEEAFPFDGRTIFESMAGSLKFETRRARSLRDAYLDRLADRKQALEHMSRQTGWQYLCHHTSDPAQSALLWLYAALGDGR
jgi:uncharacterized protein (DUF58 family)